MFVNFSLITYLASQLIALRIILGLTETCKDLLYENVVFKLLNPSAGILNKCRQSGQGISSPGRSSSPYFSRHSRQNVWMHGRHLGVLNASLQMEHSRISLHAALLFSLLAMFESMDCLSINYSALIFYFRMPDNVEKFAQIIHDLRDM